jgi:hypothetical protein
LALSAVELEVGLLARPARVKGLIRVVVESIQGDGVVQLLHETTGFQPQERSLPLGNIKVSGDVRISLCVLPLDATADARGSVTFSFTFHTAFMTMILSPPSQSATAAGPLPARRGGA